MAKQNTEPKQPVLTELKNTFHFFPFKNNKAPYIVIILLGLIFNITSLNNEYALDDGIIIHQNDWVIKGTAGIKGILTKDAYESFYRRMNATDQLAGGRYRPLSVVSFAIEQEFIGAYKNGLYPAKIDANTFNCWDQNQNNINDKEEDLNDDGVFNEVDCQVKDASLRHFVNIISLIIGVMMLFMFFKTYIFKDYHDLAFLAAIIFLMHPIHSEAIANVKSRDELFSLIFISLTFYYSFKYIDYDNVKEENTGKQNNQTNMLYFFGISMVVLVTLYIFRDAGFIILIPSLAIGALIIVSSYITLVKGRKLSRNFILAWASINFLLALLAKEYAVVLLVLLPVAVYVFSKLEFDINKFLLAFVGYILMGAGLFLFYKSYGHYKLDESTKTLAYFLLGCGSIYGGFILFKKHYAEYRKEFVIITIFIVSALVMLLIKQTHDMKATPTTKPNLSYWLFPFIFLIFGVFLVGANKKKNYTTLMSWSFFVMLFYLGMRLVAVKLKPGVPDTEILNNPYLLATGEERFMSKAFVLLNYLRLCVFPATLSSDYSYNTIEYRHFTSWDSIVSIILHLALAYAGFKLVLKRHILGFAIAVYIAFLLMIGNILMDIGATMGERLLFHSTIGFAIALAWFILKGAEKLPESMSLTTKRIAVISVVGIMTILYGAKTWERNWDWKNDITLFLKDVETMPNSVLVLGNAGARYIDLSSTKTYVSNPYDTTLTQLRDLSKKEGEDNDGVLDKMSHYLKPKFGSIETYHVDSVDAKEFNKKRVAFLEKGLKYLKHAIELHPRYVNGYLNLGLGSYQLGRDRDALFYWKQAEKLYPNNPYLTNYYNVFNNDLLNRGIRLTQRGQIDSAIYEWNKMIVLNKLNPEAYYNVGGGYYNKKEYAKAKYYWEQCVKLKPDHAQAKAGLATIITVPAPTGAVPTPVGAGQGIKQ